MEILDFATIANAFDSDVRTGVCELNEWYLIFIITYCMVRFKKTFYLSKINIILTYPIKRIVQHVLNTLQRTEDEGCQHGNVIRTPQIA